MYLTPQQVAEIRRRVAEGELQIDVARDLGVSTSAVNDVVLGQTYKESFQGKPMVEHYRSLSAQKARLSVKDVQEIRRRTRQGESQKDLATEFEVTYEDINKLVHGKIWRSVGNAIKGKLQRQGYKLTPKQVKEIRKRVRRGEYQIDVAKAFNISDVTVSKIASSSVWQGVVGNKPLTIRKHTGSRHARSVLTEALVLRARKAVKRGASIPVLAKHYGVSYYTLWFAVTGRTWKHVLGAVKRLPKCTSGSSLHVLNWTKVRQIRRLKKRGLKNRELSIMFDVSEGTISKVVRNKIWRV